MGDMRRDDSSFQRILRLFSVAAEMIMDAAVCLNCCTSRGIIFSDLEQKNKKRIRRETEEIQSIFGQGKQDSLFPVLYFSFFIQLYMLLNFLL